MAVYPAIVYLYVRWTRSFCPSVEDMSKVNVRYETQEKINSSEKFMQENVRVGHPMN